MSFFLLLALAAGALLPGSGGAGVILIQR